MGRVENEERCFYLASEHAGQTAAHGGDSGGRMQETWSRERGTASGPITVQCRTAVSVGAPQRIRGPHATCLHALPRLSALPSPPHGFPPTVSRLHVIRGPHATCLHAFPQLTTLMPPTLIHNPAYRTGVAYGAARHVLQGKHIGQGEGLSVLCTDTTVFPARCEASGKSIGLTCYPSRCDAIWKWAHAKARLRTDCL